jgi:hypothetical protein
MISEKEKEIFIRNLEELVENLGNSDWDILADFFVMWLLDHTDSETFNDFAEWVFKETNWIIKGYRDNGESWGAFFVPDWASVEEFAENWVAEKDREDFIREAKKFLEDPYSYYHQ